jgi:dephospho-CoA kinase
VVVVGIAGGSGTGKSTIARHVALRFDGEHVDADRIGHDVMSEDAGVVDALRRAFGGDAFDARGRVDRRALGRRVFSDPDALKTLNAIVHPAIMARCAVRVDVARAAGRRVAVVDAALLLEVAMPFPLDLAIALKCDRDEQRRRIFAKGGWSEAEVRARLDRQEGMEKYFYKADAVVDTGRSLNDVLKEVDALVALALDRE